MPNLAKLALLHATGLPEGAPMVAQDLLHLGNRAAVDQALSRLAKRGARLRVGRGAHALPGASRYGTRAPSALTVIAGWAALRGETMGAHGAAAANAPGLSTEGPMRAIYLTPGPSHRLRLGAQTVEFRHAPMWQLMFPGLAAGDVVRALAWLGPDKASDGAAKLRIKPPPSAMNEVASARSRRPTRLAREISALITHG